MNDDRQHIADTDEAVLDVIARAVMNPYSLDDGIDPFPADRQLAGRVLDFLTAHGYDVVTDTPAPDPSDALAAETRQLLDAATQGPWAAAWQVPNVPGMEDCGVAVVRCQKSDRIRSGELAFLGDDEQSVADATLIAAAPRLLAQWLARGQAFIDANRSLADENQALREAIGDPRYIIDMFSRPQVDRYLRRLADAVAAADRGVTDGEATT